MAKSSKGVVLRHIKDGPIEVLTRMMDFNIQVVDLGGKQTEIPANTLVAFRAESFREIEPESDEWEFVSMQPTPGGPVKSYIYLSGADLFMIRAMSKLA